MAHYRPATRDRLEELPFLSIKQLKDMGILEQPGTKEITLSGKFFSPIVLKLITRPIGEGEWMCQVQFNQVRSELKISSFLSNLKRGRVLHFLCPESGLPSRKLYLTQDHQWINGRQAGAYTVQCLSKKKRGGFALSRKYAKCLHLTQEKMERSHFFRSQPTRQNNRRIQAAAFVKRVNHALDACQT